MANRPPIPVDLYRLTLIEAGHRCAIHTCRQVLVEIAHIDPWAKCREHRIENLIALCPTCHTRFDRGEIDRQSMLVYKQRLATAMTRYGDLERRVLELFAREPNRQEIRFLVDLEILLANLLADGLLVEGRPEHHESIAGVMVRRSYELTSLGRAHVGRLQKS